MQSRRLKEIRDLTASPEFQAWWSSLVAARAAVTEAERGRDDWLAQFTLLDFRAELTQKQAIDTLYRAGEHEDEAARLHVEAEALENRAFPGVAAFEEQRYRVSELWYRLGAIENEVEQAAQKILAPSEKAALDKKYKAAEADYHRESQKKDKQWAEVEATWTKSAEVALKTSEARMLAKKVRREAETLFGLAEERKKKAVELKAEADAASAKVDVARAEVDRLRRTAEERFGAAVGTDFLYFRHRDDRAHAFAIALVDDRDAYNVEVKPLAVYSVDRRRGVSFLEPARAAPPSLEESDRRFDSYFLTGRKGQVRV